jgi:hypothetical protein
VKLHSVPNETALVRLVRAILLKQNDKWAVQRPRCTTLESIAPLAGRIRLRAGDTIA